MQAIIVRHRFYGVDFDSRAYAGYLERFGSQMPARALEFARRSWLEPYPGGINMHDAALDSLHVAESQDEYGCSSVALTLRLHLGESSWRLEYGDVVAYNLALTPYRENSGHWDLLADEMSVLEEDSLLRHELLFNRGRYVILCRTFDFDAQIADCGCCECKGSNDV